MIPGYLTVRVSSHTFHATVGFVHTTSDSVHNYNGPTTRQLTQSLLSLISVSRCPVTIKESEGCNTVYRRLRVPALPFWLVNLTDKAHDRPSLIQLLRQLRHGTVSGRAGGLTDGMSLCAREEGVYKKHASHDQ